jgi:hypothetical protein
VGTRLDREAMEKRKILPLPGFETRLSSPWPIKLDMSVKSPLLMVGDVEKITIFFPSPSFHLIDTNTSFQLTFLILKR